MPLLCRAGQISAATDLVFPVLENILVLCPSANELSKAVLLVSSN